MSPGRLRAIRALVLVTMLLLACRLQSATAQTYHVTVDTTGLSGITGRLVFDVIDGDGTNGNNLASITSFMTDGTLAGGGNMNTAGASGSLPGAVTVQDTEFFNESYRNITFGTSLSYDFDFTNNFAGGSPDEFSFFLLDSTGASSLVSTSDPTGFDSLFVLDATGGAGNSPTVYSSNTANVSWTVTPAAAPTPEFSSLFSLAGMLAAGGGGLWLRRRRGARANKAKGPNPARPDSTVDSTAQREVSGA